MLNLPVNNGVNRKVKTEKVKENRKKLKKTFLVLKPGKPLKKAVKNLARVKTPFKEPVFPQTGKRKTGSKPVKV